MATQSSFLEDIIDDNIPMQPMHPVVFDLFLEEGWRLLGHSVVRHNFSICRGSICKTLPLRIDLKNFRFSKSQRQMLGKARSLHIEKGPIQINQEKAELFLKHTDRFRERQPASITAFLGPEANTVPVRGKEYRIYMEEKLVACSFVHMGKTAVSGTYCFFDPDIKGQSFGSLTMLLEIQDAIESGFRYYYHGYCYDVPSQFDYKRNFHALETMDWQSFRWAPMDRLPVRNWDELVQ